MAHNWLQRPYERGLVYCPEQQLGRQAPRRPAARATRELGHRRTSAGGASLVLAGKATSRAAGLTAWPWRLLTGVSMEAEEGASGAVISCCRAAEPQGGAGGHAEPARRCFSLCCRHRRIPWRGRAGQPVAERPTQRRAGHSPGPWGPGGADRRRGDARGGTLRQGWAFAGYQQLDSLLPVHGELRGHADDLRAATAHSVRAPSPKPARGVRGQRRRQQQQRLAACRRRRGVLAGQTGATSGQ